MTSQPGSRYKLLLRVVPIMVLGLVGLVVLQKILTPAPPCDTAPPRSIQQQSVSAAPLWTMCFSSEPDQKLFLYDDSLLVGDDQRHEIAAYDVFSGGTKWSFPLGNWTVHKDGLILDPGRQRLYASVGDGTVSHFYGLYMSSGTRVWDHDTEINEVLTPAVLADQRLIGISTSQVYNIDPDTGIYIGGTSGAAPVIYPDGYSWEMTDGRLTASDAMMGDVLWQASDANPQETYLRDVQRNDHLVLAAHWDYLAAYDFATGRLLWRSPTFKLAGRPALFGETVYALGLDARLHILNASTGIEQGFIQFEPTAPDHDKDISGSQLVANDQMIAIHFADTDLLSVYQITQP